MRTLDHHAWLGLIIVFIAAGLDALVIFRGLPTGVDGNITSVILTAWNGLATLVANWAFGSSSQTAKLSDQLAAATPATLPNVAQAATDATQATPRTPGT